VKSVIEEMDARTTPRLCAECARPATLWRYRRNVEGGKDKSSKRPMCEAHRELPGGKHEG
jgi:hypothetical protein